jgi:hypothetical protein
MTQKLSRGQHGRLQQMVALQFTAKTQTALQVSVLVFRIMISATSTFVVGVVLFTVLSLLARLSGLG